VLVLPIHSPSALGAGSGGGAGAAPLPPLPPHAANASIHDMAKAWIIVIILGFTIAPCDHCGGVPSLVASFRGNAKKFDRFSYFIPFMLIDRSIDFTLDIPVNFSSHGITPANTAASQSYAP
jgi:hypothetical protein